MTTDDDEAFQAFEEYCAETVAANEAWCKRWPNHCEKCEGKGGFQWVEMHGFTHGAGEQMYDICACVEAGNCPRCGTVAWAVDNEDETPCPTCGWNWCKGKDDVAPQI